MLSTVISGRAYVRLGKIMKKIILLILLAGVLLVFSTTINGVDTESIATIGGIDIANIGSINGVK